MKKVVLAIIVLSCAILLISNTVYAYDGLSVEVYDYHVEEAFIDNGSIITINKQIMTTQVNSMNQNYRGVSHNTSDLIELYGLDHNSFIESHSVIIQSEYLNYGVTNRDFMIEIDPGGGGGGGSTNPEVTWEDDEGYIKITTIAYHKGYNSSGNKIYEVSGRVDFKKQFGLYYQDRLIIRHGNNAVFHSNNASSMIGTHYAVSSYSAGGQPISSTPVYNSITPNYSSVHGVDYAFKLISKYTQPGSLHNTSRDIYVQGNYFIVATNDTVVQTVYVHNERFLGLDLGISIGAYGVGIDISGGNTSYYSTPLTLTN